MKYTVTSKPWKSIFNKVQTLFKSIKQENRANQSTSNIPIHWHLSHKVGKMALWWVIMKGWNPTHQVSWTWRYHCTL